MKRKKVASDIFLAMRFMADITAFEHMRTFKNVPVITKDEFASYRNTIRIKI